MAEDISLYTSQITFDFACQSAKVSKDVSRIFIYEIYIMVIESLMKLLNDRHIPSLGRIKPEILLLYIVKEHQYATYGMSQEDIEKTEQNETYKQRLTGIILDKYFTLELLPYRESYEIPEYYPPLTSLQLYATYLLHLCNQFKQKDPKQTLVIDILHKGFLMTKSITDLLSSGFQTEAFSIWRTLHETECIAIILAKYGQTVIDSYLRHATYGLAFRNALGTKEEEDQIFVEIKEKNSNSIAQNILRDTV